MEFTFLLLVVAGALLGFVLRRVVSPGVARAFAVAGVLCLMLGIGILGMAASDHSPFDTLTSGLIAAALLALAGLLLPFTLVVRWSRLSARVSSDS